MIKRGKNSVEKMRKWKDKKNKHEREGKTAKKRS